MKVLATMGFVLLVAFPQITLAAPDQPALTTTELKTLLNGNSMAGNGKTRLPAAPYDWIAYYGEDGIMTIRLKPEWGGGVDTGKWWISENGELCRQFSKMASGKKGCWLFYHEGDFYRFIPSSGLAVEGLATVIKGNLLERQPAR